MKRIEYKPMSQPPQPKERRDVVAEESAKFEKEIIKFMAQLKGSKKLDKNKSIREIDLENSQFSDLVGAARRVELVEPAKGTMGLAIVAMRMLLFINNKMNEFESDMGKRINELAADMEKFQKEVSNKLPKEDVDEAPEN